MWRCLAWPGFKRPKQSLRGTRQGIFAAFLRTNGIARQGFNRWSCSSSFSQRCCLGFHEAAKLDLSVTHGNCLVEGMLPGLLHAGPPRSVAMVVRPDL